MIRPNVSNRVRVFYALAGSALVGAPFLFDLTHSVRWIMVAVGIVALLEGAIGW